MGKLTKIQVEYEITDPPMLVQSFDEFEGKIMVTNNSENDSTLKELFIDCYEIYDDDYGEGPDPRKNKLN